MPLVLLNKPHRVLCQFTDPEGRPNLSDFVQVPAVYPAGRLDYDSEGLLLLTDDGKLQARISQPQSKTPKTYWVQVEGSPTAGQLQALQSGVELKDGAATALSVAVISEPQNLWPRDPPVRTRRSIPDSWLELTIDEGRNRQVRRMTAAVGLPTLRLVRERVAVWSLESLAPGESRQIDNPSAWRQIRSGVLGPLR